MRLLSILLKVNMKMTLVFLFSFFVFCPNSHAQFSIENPDCGYSTANNLEIRKVEIVDSFTIVTFHIEFGESDWIFIPKQSYISPVGQEDKLYVVKAEGIPLGERYTGGVADYRLFFPAIDPAVEKIDFGEGNKGGSWFIYDIELKEKLFERPMPDRLVGNWMDTEGRKEVVVAFYDTLAVFQGEVWRYGQVSDKDGICNVELLGSTRKTELAVRTIDSVSIRLSEAGQKPTILCQCPGAKSLGRPAKGQPYQLPVFQPNGNAVYKGVIRNYSTRIHQKTGQIHLDNIVSGNQESYTFNIASDGSFSIELPVFYPHFAYVRLPSSYGSVYLEPGKTTFQLIDTKNKKNKDLFMGETATLNAELAQLNPIRYFDYDEMQDTILKMNPETYKIYCLSIRDRELAELNQRAEIDGLTAKAIQIKTIGINYSALSNVMGYARNFESAYRQKNKIPREKRTLDIDIEKPDSLYYDFLNDETCNNPLAVISNEYGTFINRLKYMSLFSDAFPSINAIVLLSDMAKNGELVLTPEEEFLIREMRKLEDPEFDEKMRELFSVNKDLYMTFVGKHQEIIKELNQEKDFVIWYDLEPVLIERGIEVLPVEHNLLESVKMLRSKEEHIERNRFLKTNREGQEAMFKKYEKVIKQAISAEKGKRQVELMKSRFGIEAGFAADLFAAQDLSRTIVEESTPMEDEALEKNVQVIRLPFIRDYLVSSNLKAKKKLEENKEKTGYYVNQTPTVESEKLFDALMSKFKGKVVFVDFWATWCGSCRSGIERIKPLKEELAGRDVVFVYITNDTSPQGTWENMIPDIKGEHFKLTRDEWNVLSARFNISGIPHYVLVDKLGQVANNNTMRSFDNKALKDLLEEYLQK